MFCRSCVDIDQIHQIREAFVEALMTMPREQAVAVLGELLRNRPTLAPRLGAVVDVVYDFRPTVERFKNEDNE